MILEKPFLLFVLPATFLALGLAVASFHVTPTPYRPPEYSLNNELAIITANEGHVEISRFHTSHSSPLPKGQKLSISLYNLDRIQTRLASKTRVQFLDGYELEFRPKSMFVIEQWSPKDNQGPIYMNLLAGDYKVIQKGRPGSVFIVKQGQVFDPLRKPQKNLRVLATHIHSSIETSVVTAKQSKKPKNNDIAEVKVPLTKAPLIRTLSNEYIDETIAKSRDQFVKCQQYAIRENKASKGQLLVGLSIEPIGKMKEVQVLASDIKNPELHNCILKVLGRTSFRSFDGPEIVRSYPFIFE